MVKRVVALLALLVLASGVRADFIPITNPGFEDPPDAVFNTGPITGWTISGSGAGVWNINAAPLGFWDVGAPEGKQIAFVARETEPGVAATISQTLSDLLLASTTYNLTGQVGHPKGFGATADPDTVYTVELLAGANVLASVSGTGPEGSFVPFALSFDSTGSSFVGQALQIRLSSSKSQTGFDDLRLEAVSPAAVPEPSSMVLSLIGGLGLALGARRTRDRRRPLASSPGSGEVITAPCT